MNETLYIIGNGFDLHHGLKTSYSDFRDNCAKKKTVLWQPLQEIYGDAINNDMWWSNFEEILGKINYGHLTKTYNGDALGAVKVQNFLKGVLPPLFGEWFEEIKDTAVVDKQLGIDPKSLFFSFNYTLTLETVYHVKAGNVWHIHGSIKDVDNIVVGHDSDDRKLFVEYLAYENEHSPIDSAIADDIRTMAASGAKCVESRIVRYGEEFSNQYHNIKHIIVMGFSFNDIDKPYIEAIMNANTNVDSVDWTIYYHEDGGDNKMIDKLTQMGVKRNRINKPIKW